MSGHAHDHDLHVERLGNGVTMGECSCGAWEMRVGPDATTVRSESEEDLLARNFREHMREPLEHGPAS